MRSFKKIIMFKGLQYANLPSSPPPPASGNNKKITGFSLVELSIVLVILGLLVGGVLAGQSLIKAAELRSVTTDFQKYQTAVTTFRDKYFYLPGDMPNAVRFWGAQAGAVTDGRDTTCVALTTAATGTATCNGDGDGRIGINAAQYYEAFRVWQHMANAGMIEGQYSGVAGSGGTLHHVIGTNCPKAKSGTAGWGVYSYNPAPPEMFPSRIGTSWFYGAQHSTFFPSVAQLIPEDAYNIDTKVDDGLPGNGGVQTWKATNRPNCASTDDPVTAVYVLTEKVARCNLVFASPF